MSMMLWLYSGGPRATVLWDFHDARAAESAETTAHDSDESEADESETGHPLEGRLSPYFFRPPRLGGLPLD